jgi:hypothetical protein
MSVSAPPARRTGIRAAYQSLLPATVAALVLSACSSGGTPASQGVRNGGILRGQKRNPRPSGKRGN